MTAVEKKHKGVFSFSLREMPALTFKNLISVCLTVGALVAILLFPVMQISKNVISISLNGLHVLSALSFDSILYAKQQGVQFEIQVPIYMSVFMITAVAVLIIFIVFHFINLKKNRLTRIIAWGEVAFCVALLIFYLALLLSPALKTVSPINGEATTFYESYQAGPGILVAALIAGMTGWMGLSVKDKRLPYLKKYFLVYLLIAIPVALIFVMNIYPVWLQTILAFKDYKLSDGIWGSRWVGLEHFRTIFGDPVMLHVIGNTIYISVLRFVAGLIPPIIFAIVLFDLRMSRLRKCVQTIVYIPHFLSWVVVYAIVYAFLTPDGVVNKIIIEALGMQGFDFLASEKLFLPIQIITSIWKEVGWGTILYTAALSNVDTSLYEAAALDGAGPIKRNIYITLPSIANVIVFLMIISIGNILKGAGGEQMLIFANNAVMEKATVIDTWVYWQGLGKMQYGLGAAVSFFQSVIGVILVLFSNKFSRKVTGVGMW